MLFLRIAKVNSTRITTFSINAKISREMNSGESFAKVNSKNFSFFSLANVSPREIFYT